MAVIKSKFPVSISDNNIKSFPRLMYSKFEEYGDDIAIVSSLSFLAFNF